MMHKKPIEMLLHEASRTGEGTLKRSLTAFSLTAVGIGMIIGAGLFSLTGFAAANYAGPANHHFICNSSTGLCVYWFMLR